MGPCLCRSEWGMEPVSCGRCPESVAGNTGTETRGATGIARPAAVHEAADRRRPRPLAAALRHTPPGTDAGAGPARHRDETPAGRGHPAGPPAEPGRTGRKTAAPADRPAAGAAAPLCPHSGTAAAGPAARRAAAGHRCHRRAHRSGAKPRAGRHRARNPAPATGTGPAGTGNPHAGQQPLPAAGQPARAGTADRPQQDTGPLRAHPGRR